MATRRSTRRHAVPIAPRSAASADLVSPGTASAPVQPAVSPIQSLDLPKPLSVHAAFVAPSRDMSAAYLRVDEEMSLLGLSPSVGEQNLAAESQLETGDVLVDGADNATSAPAPASSLHAPTRRGRQPARGRRGCARGRGSASTRRRKDPNEGRTFLESPAVQVVNEKSFKAEVCSQTARMIH